MREKLDQDKLKDKLPYGKWLEEIGVKEKEIDPNTKKVLEAVWNKIEEVEKE